jgi:hypothetical protein
MENSYYDFEKQAEEYFNNMWPRTISVPGKLEKAIIIEIMTAFAYKTYWKIKNATMFICNCNNEYGKLAEQQIRLKKKEKIQNEKC